MSCPVAGPQVTPTQTASQVLSRLLLLLHLLRLLVQVQRAALRSWLQQPWCVAERFQQGGLTPGAHTEGFPVSNMAPHLLRHPLLLSAALHEPAAGAPLPVPGTLQTAAALPLLAPG
jgi:hypothetical protein